MVPLMLFAREWVIGKLKKVQYSKILKPKKIKNVQQQKFAHPPIFNAEENKLSECLSLTKEWGFLLTAFDIRWIVKKILNKRSAVEPWFINNMPGKK